MNRSLIILVPALLASACSDEAASPDGEAGSAPSEVLQGSISDEMIPYDRLRSQPPLAEILPGEEGSDSAFGSTAPGPGGIEPSPPSADAAAAASTPTAVPAVDEPPTPQTD